jgi:hypothetical protein
LVLAKDVVKMLKEKKKMIQSEQGLSSEIIAFCGLLARIMMRCLREKDPRIVPLLSLPSPSKGETHNDHVT